jgi:hypothetical protein
MLGFARDNPVLFERAISYLASPPAKSVILSPEAFRRAAAYLEKAKRENEKNRPMCNHSRNYVIARNATRALVVTTTDNHCA